MKVQKIALEKFVWLFFREEKIRKIKRILFRPSGEYGLPVCVQKLQLWLLPSKSKYKYYKSIKLSELFRLYICYYIYTLKKLNQYFLSITTSSICTCVDSRYVGVFQ